MSARPSALVVVESSDALQEATAAMLQDPVRLHALALAAALMDSEHKEAFDRLTRLAAKQLCVPIAAITLLDAQRLFLKSAVGLGDLRETPVEHSFCQYTVGSRKPFVVEDARSHTLLQNKPAVLNGEVLSYAGMPLITPEGHALGTLCVADTTPRVWTGDQLDLLQELATAAASEIALRVLARLQDQRVKEAQEAHRIADQALLALEESERALRDSEKRFRRLADAAFEGIAVSDQGIVIDTNQAMADLFGYASHELLGMSPRDLVIPENNDAVLSRARAYSEETYECMGLRKNGERFFLEVRARHIEHNGRVLRITAMRDISERKRTEMLLAKQAEDLRSLSLVDELTGVFNRRGFLELARQQLKVADRSERSCALFFADINGMKAINDQLGHEQGDRTLRDTARVLTATFRDSDIVARLGGDEFVVLAVEAGAEQIEALQKRFCDHVHAFNAQEGCIYRLSVSLGVALYDPHSRQTIEALLAHADAVMYEQKRLRRARGGLSIPVARSIES